MKADVEIPANLRAFVRALRADGYEVTVRAARDDHEPSRLVGLVRTCMASASTEGPGAPHEEDPPAGRPPARWH